MKALLYLLLFAPILSCSAQEKAKNSILNIEMNWIDTSDHNFGYYLSVKPKAKELKGVLFLMPGFGQKPQDIFLDTKLHEFAFENGLLTIGFSGQMRLVADSLIQTRMNQILTDVLAKNKVDKNNFIFGGFSAGGRIALRYVELCKQYPDRFPVNPAAVFAIDAPVDVFDSWKITQDLKERNLSKISVDEANWVEKTYKHYYHCTPSSDPVFFMTLSPFSLDKKYGENEKYLKDIPVRTYHDIDVPWRLNNRNQSVQDCNYVATSQMINRLLLLGNKEAEFIQTHKTGYRRNGARHPHSWSIVDEKECVDWVLKILSKEETKPISAEGKSIIAIDKAAMSGLNLSRGRNPKQPERKLFFKNIFSGEELRVQVVSSENAFADPENLEIDEFLFMINGGAKLSPLNGAEQSFLSGDFFMVPRGYSGRWETIGSPDYHLEVTVTTMDRNESAADPKKSLPILIDKKILAGIDSRKSTDEASDYRQLLYEGHELNVVLEEERPGVKKIDQPLKEQVVYILSGSVTVWDSSGASQQFNTGDFFIIPSGFYGIWKSEGQQLFRSLRVCKNVWD